MVLRAGPCLVTAYKCWAMVRTSTLHCAPFALSLGPFCSLSLRYGEGLFITSDLLQQGSLILGLAALTNSLAGLTMERGRSIIVDSAASQAPPSAILICVPCGARRSSPDSNEDPPFYVGTVTAAVPRDQRYEMLDR